LVEECKKTRVCVEKSALDAVDAVHRVTDDGDGVQFRKIRCFDGDGLIDDVDDGLELRYIVVMNVGKKERCSDDFPFAGAANEENGSTSAGAIISLGAISEAKQMRIGWSCWNKRRRWRRLGNSLAVVKGRWHSKNIVELRDE